MNACKVCSHPRVADADALLNAGTSDYKVANAIGLTRASVMRHRASGHVKPGSTASVPPARRGQRARPETDGTPASLVRQILGDLDAVDVSTLSTSAQVAYFNTRLRAIAELNRIAPSTLPAETEADAVIKALKDIIAAEGAVIDLLPAPLRAVFAVALHAQFEGRKKGPTPASTLALAARGEEILARIAAEDHA